MSERQREARETKLAALRAKDKKEAAQRKVLIFSSLGAVLLVLGVVIWIILQSGTANTNNGDKVPEANYNSAAQLEITETSIILGKQGVEPLVTVFEDLMCHYCAIFEEDAGTALVTAAETGKARVEYSLVSILDGNSRDGRYSTRAANAVVAAAVHSPEQWVDFHAALYEAQPTTGGTLTDEAILKIAKDSGIQNADFESDVKAVSYGGWITDLTTAARQSGLEGTPTVFLDGERTNLLTAEEWSVELGL